MKSSLDRSAPVLMIHLLSVLRPGRRQQVDRLDPEELAQGKRGGSALSRTSAVDVPGCCRRAAAGYTLQGSLTPPPCSEEVTWWSEDAGEDRRGRDRGVWQDLSGERLADAAGQRPYNSGNTVAIPVKSRNFRPATS